MSKVKDMAWDNMFQLDTVKPEEVETPEEGKEAKPKEEVVKPKEKPEPKEVEEEEEVEGEEEEEEEKPKDNKDKPEDKPADKSKKPEGKETPEVKKKDDKPKEEDKPSDFSAILTNLVDKGVLEFDDKKEYEDSEEGIKEIIQDNIKAGVENWKKELGDEALQVLEHIKAGGSLKDLIEMETETDYKNDVDLKNPVHQKYVVEDYLKLQGFEEDEIVEKVQKYQDSGILADESITAQKQLIKDQDKRRAKLINDTKENAKIKEANDLKAQKEFKDMIMKTSEIAGFKLDETEKEKLHNYITKPVKGGQTQLQLDNSDEQRLKIAYFMMKGFKFDNVEKGAITKATLKIKKKINNVTDKQMKPKGGEEVEQKKNKESNDIPMLPWFQSQE